MVLKGPGLDLVSQSVKEPSDPSQGQSFDVSRAQLTSMMEDFIEQLIGKSHPTPENFWQEQLAIFDENEDGMYSEEEVRQLFVLLNRREFLHNWLLGISHLPRLHGFCGEVYAVEGTQPHPLLAGGKLPYRHSTWEVRSQLALSFLDLIVKFENTTFGTLHLCDLSPSAFGLHPDGQLQILQTAGVFMGNELKSVFGRMTCQYDSDCVVTTTCHSRCKENGRCDDERTTTNLQVRASNGKQLKCEAPLLNISMSLNVRVRLFRQLSYESSQLSGGGKPRFLSFVRNTSVSLLSVGKRYRQAARGNWLLQSIVHANLHSSLCLALLAIT